MNFLLRGNLTTNGASHLVITLMGVFCWIFCSTADLLGQTGSRREWNKYPTVVSPQSLAVAYWRERIFLIPYQIQPHSSLGGRLDKVELLVSRDGATDWKSLGKAEANVQGFRYYTPDDGDYWFALQLFDRRGDLLQAGPLQPQLHVIVDTVQPVLSIAGSIDVGGAIVLRYEASDRNLKSTELVIQSQTEGQAWVDVSIGRHDVHQTDRLMGRVKLAATPGVIPSGEGDRVKFRASIADRAGHKTYTTTEVLMEGPQLLAAGSPRLDQLLGANHSNVPALNAIAAQPHSTTPYSAVADSRRSPEETRKSNVGTGRDQTALDWPAYEPYRRTPAQLVATGQAKRPAGSKAELPVQTNRQNKGPAPGEKAQGWTGKSSHSAGQTDKALRMVGARTFEIEYDLNSVGPWGVAKVELWGTYNQGQTWESFSIDHDNRSPVRVTVPAEGIYGFRILVDGANGASSAPPRSGDFPEFMVRVDLKAPQAQLRPIERGQGNQVDHLVLRWTASDDNLEKQPISLFYSSSPHGPWSTIAARLKNTGNYSWRLQRHVPDQFYLRLEVRDMAGNLTTAQSQEPVTLMRPQPTGRLRGIRPVGPRGAGTATGIPLVTNPAPPTQLLFERPQLPNN
jgi:hypothetical protein